MLFSIFFQLAFATGLIRKGVLLASSRMIYSAYLNESELTFVLNEDDYDSRILLWGKLGLVLFRRCRMYQAKRSSPVQTPPEVWGFR